MNMLNWLKEAGRVLKREFKVFRLIATDPRTPLLSKLLLGLAVFYLLLPCDIIPDWIPFLGQIDDLIIIPVLLILAFSRIPKEVIAEARKNAEDY